MNLDDLTVERIDCRDAVFHSVPLELQGADPNFVAPLAFEERRQLDPRTNPHFAEAEIACFLARRKGKPVGRISAHVDHVALRHANDSTGFFGHWEVEDHPATAAALLGVAEAWLKDRGMARVRGPFEVSVNDRCGLLVEGGDAPPMLMMNHAPPHYARLLEEAGYAKARDLLAYHTPVEARLPTQGTRLLERLEGRVRIRPIRWDRYRDEIDTIIDIFNDAWGGNWGFVPFTKARLDHLARSMKPILMKDLVVIAEVEGKPAGMMIALPNVNEATADLRGRLLPLGWVKLLWRLKVGRLRTLRVPLMGVRREYHGTLIGAALMTFMFDTIRAAAYARGFREAELSWVLEDNRPMQHISERMGARVYKRYRLYEKAL
jgi:GNAT superfamily N-acetyltransferase